jgi:hypothetical protein
VTTVLEHFKSHKTPPTKMPGGFTIAPTVQAIVVDGVAIINPKLASIIRNYAQSVMACPEDPHAASPAYSKMIVAVES